MSFMLHPLLSDLTRWHVVSNSEARVRRAVFTSVYVTVGEREITLLPPVNPARTTTMRSGYTVWKKNVRDNVNTTLETVTGYGCLRVIFYDRVTTRRTVYRHETWDSIVRLAEILCARAIVKNNGQQTTDRQTQNNQLNWRHWRRLSVDERANRIERGKQRRRRPDGAGRRRWSTAAVRGTNKAIELVETGRDVGGGGGGRSFGFCLLTLSRTNSTPQRHHRPLNKTPCSTVRTRWRRRRRQQLTDVTRRVRNVSDYTGYQVNGRAVTCQFVW